MLKIIVAVSDNGVIGRAGGLPWRLRDDLKWFKQKTGKHPVVMGRKTYESILKQLGTPLPGRENIILTRNANVSSFFTGCTVINDWNTVLERAQKEDVFVIGGAELYELALPEAGELYLTRVHTKISGDTYFPLAWDEGEWDRVWRESRSHDEKNEYDFTWVVYHRKV